MHFQSICTCYYRYDSFLELIYTKRRQKQTRRKKSGLSIAKLHYVVNIIHVWSFGICTHASHSAIFSNMHLIDLWVDIKKARFALTQCCICTSVLSGNDQSSWQLEEWGSNDWMRPRVACDAGGSGATGGTDWPPLSIMGSNVELIELCHFYMLWLLPLKKNIVPSIITPFFCQCLPGLLTLAQPAATCERHEVEWLVSSCSALYTWCGSCSPAWSHGTVYEQHATFKNILHVISHILSFCVCCLMPTAFCEFWTCRKWQSHLWLLLS